jgi:pimeloyl-ACP methyl ester carboxylesterase
VRAARARPLVALLIGASLLASACSQEGGTAAPSTTRPDRTTTSERSTTSTTDPSTTSSTSTTVPGAPAPIEWSDCDGGFECGTVVVPIDYSDPTGKTMKIAVVRRPAKDQANRIGSLFMNPGGPGGSAIDLVEAIPLPSTLTDRFDIVGFDPRGVGRSHPLNCRSHLQKMYDDDPSIDTPQDKQVYLADSKAFVDECAGKYASLLPHLGTRDVARDMDRVRQALGEPKLNYVGYSYGTSIGQAYASLFPTKVRSMVLDGVVDLSQDGLQGAAGQAGGFSLALDNFIKDCDSNGCGLPAEAGGVIDEVIADAERKPIPANGVDRPATPGVVNLALAQGLYVQSLWPQLASALKAARQGRGAALVRLADSYLQRNVDGTYPNGFEIYFAVSCIDQSFPHNPDTVMAAAKVTGTKYPRFGEGLVNDYVRCAMWPTPAQPLKPVPKTTKGLPPVVVISTTGDPATPYQNGVRVAKQIPTGHLITNVGEGHTVFAEGKACIDDAVTDYLVDVKAPPAGLTCK